MDIVSAIVGRIAACMFRAALRQIGYLVHYNHNIKSLKEQAQLLTDKRERVQGKIDTAAKINNGEKIIIKSEVEKWIKEVDEITAEAERFLDDEANNKANMRCLRGRCINVWSVYRFSNEALHKAKLISRMLEDYGSFGVVVSSSSSPPVPSQEEIVTSSEGFSGEIKEEKKEESTENNNKGESTNNH